MINLDAFALPLSAELNFLLSEAHEAACAGDLGLFCREHAFCTAAVGAIYGLDVSIVRGEVVVDNPTSRLACTRATGDEHYWCAIGDRPVFDMSLNFRQIRGFRNLDGPVSNIGHNGHYDVVILERGIQEFPHPDGGFKVWYRPISVTHTKSSELVPWASSELIPDCIDLASAVSLHTAELLCGRSKSLSVLGRSQADCLDFLTSAIPSAASLLHRKLGALPANQSLERTEESGSVC